jgi:2-polyprenyl-6-hydroxyphenyl methylase/3-demethylubiquinone-9 3-methyltransferase
LTGVKFLDVGCGSGLFSLVARRLGATVHSFDYDPQSVACAEELRHRYFAGDTKWVIERGSVLDQKYLASLGQFDIVYSWGVLHHTGEMWKALASVTALVGERGRLCIALYNDQGWLSKFWKSVKSLYCSSFAGKAIVCAIFIPIYTVRAVLSGLVHRRRVFRAYRQERGMSMVHDWFDWLGGFPFDVAGVEEVVAFYEQRGFAPEKVIRGRAAANNQFVFVRSRQASARTQSIK